MFIYAENYYVHISFIGGRDFEFYFKFKFLFKFKFFFKSHPFVV